MKTKEKEVEESLVKDLPEKKVEESSTCCAKTVVPLTVKLLEAPKKIDPREAYSALTEQEYWGRMYY